MTVELPQNTMETEDLPLPNELIYEPVMRRVDRQSTANHLAIYVLQQWKRSIPKVVFRPPVGYLEPICSMHIDIFYEIFEHLHPIDLYHISQVNRAFQTLLSHPNSGSAWNLAFEKDPDIPKCPPETPAFPTKMSGLEWAGMLFGKHICEGCGEGGTPPNIPFRRFQCDDCAVVNDRLIGSEECYISEDVVVLTNSQVLNLSLDGDLLNIDGFVLDTSDPWYLHSQAELDAVRKACARYEDAIRMEEPGARGAYDAYRAKRKAEVDPINEHFATCLQWAEGLRKCYAEGVERKRMNLMKKIRSRFGQMGHHPEDVGKLDANFKFTFYNKSAFHIPRFLSLEGHAPRLSNKRWETLKPLLEPTIIRAKNERQARERGILLKKREGFVHELYREYKKSVSPSKWAYLPSHYAVYQFKPFASLINALHDNKLNKDCCEDALRCLPKEIDDWTVEKKRYFVSLLPRRSDGGLQPRLDVSPSLETFDPLHEPEVDFDALQLATSVFRCSGPNTGQRHSGLCLIGWEAAGPHLCCSALETRWERQMFFSQRGHRAATALVNLAGLDPRTTTATDMDQLDYRYMCNTCPVVALTGRQVYNWRDAVLHYIDKGESRSIQARSKTPMWSLLTAYAEAKIKRREGPDPSTSWSCALCPEHFKNMVQREGAINHVKSTHNILTPVETTHFFYLITTDLIARRQVSFPQSPPSEYTCTHCVSRLYNKKRRMLRHLRSSHQVEEPVAERDWVRLQTVLRST